MNSRIMTDIQIALNAHVPILIWGGPGLGKSASITQLSQLMDLPLAIVIASIREPSDFSGLPVISENGVTLSPPSWAKYLAEQGKGILFFDEISTAPPAVQAALLRVVLDGCVGDLQLPPGVRMIAAANPPEIAAGGWDLSPPLANRFCHLDWPLEAMDWCEGMITGWKNQNSLSNFRLSEIPEAVYAQKRALIASFIKTRPALLFQFPKEEGETGKAWPSPRTWDMAAKLMSSCQVSGYSDQSEVCVDVVSGVVGTGAALEFFTWREQVDLPNPDELLKDPRRFKLEQNKRGDIVYAILTSVAAAVVSNNTVDRWKAGWKILGIAADQGFTDVAAMSAKTLAKNQPNTVKDLPESDINKFYKILVASGLASGGK